ncbi:protein FAM229A [Apus apus]|uniref:protein FAM229A n=1 Tax=Apus apus TaxID=8895 RepID=UPI0021F84FD1|nr:protein FAM229A [Apus apus]
MSSQRSQQAQRFPVEAGDCRGSPAPPGRREPAGTERPAGRQLCRCFGNHCLTLPNVPMDVFIARGGHRRPRTS